jgi:hypothetical protein
MKYPTISLSLLIEKVFLTVDSIVPLIFSEVKPPTLNDCCIKEYNIGKEIMAKANSFLFINLVAGLVLYLQV